jgi:acyl dehydratase
MNYRSLHWEDIKEGLALPSIKYELSLLRLVSFLRATGLYDYVHFDKSYAQLLGARDAFASTPHVAGLFSRLLTDWSGPEADIKSLAITINGQSCVDDILTVTGKVGKKYRNDRDEHLVDVVDLNIGHSLAPNAAVASATMAFPSKLGESMQDSGAVILNQDHGTPANPNIPDFARLLMGKPSTTQRKVRPLTEDAIHLWCESLEDWNPLYWDKSYAAKSRYGSLIAPAAGNFFGTGSSATLGIGYLKPGETVPDPIRKGLTGLPLLQALRQNMLAANTPLTLTDYPAMVLVESRAEYHKPTRPGDSVRFTEELVDCSPKKTTKLGEGYFVDSLQFAHNQSNKLVQTQKIRRFYYRPRTQLSCT